MSYRAITQRIAYIDSRLRHRQDYPSAPELARGLQNDHGEEVTTRTIQRDIEKMRDRGAPIEYDPHRHGYYYTDMSWQLPGIDLTEGDLMALMVGDRALEGYRNSPYYDELRSVFDRLTTVLPDKVTVAPGGASGRVVPPVLVAPPRGGSDLRALSDEASPAAEGDVFPPAGVLR